VTVPAVPLAGTHRESHRSLLLPFRVHAARPVDAVVVPAGRTTGHLAAAASLAADLGAVLVALCSAGAAAGEVAGTVADVPGLRWFAADVPTDHDHPLLSGTRSDLRGPDRGGRPSLSRKRNVALLLARMVGWRTVLLLDDDIVRLSSAMISWAATGLGRASAVGLAVERWPDNSVVCHANRLGGGDQDVFVSGSALLVDCAGGPGFFPTVYNEDWFFLFDQLRRRRVTRLGSVGQLRYDPFRQPERAAAEEFGEVLAEGLVDLLHRRYPLAYLLDEAYWTGFLHRREAFIARAAERIARQDATPVHRAALRALGAAERRRREIGPDRCVAFVEAWRTDLRLWRRRLDGIRPAPGVEAAAGVLGLAGSLRASRGGRTSHRRRDEAVCATG
jgi:hypothetical protein